MRPSTVDRCRRAATRRHRDPPTVVPSRRSSRHGDVPPVDVGRYRRRPDLSDVMRRHRERAERDAMPVDDADLLGPLDGARRRTSCTAPTWPRARPGCRSPSTCRPRPATTPTTPMARGEVGKVGVPVAHLGHMRTLLDGIPPGEMNTSMTINATAAWLLGAVRRQRRGAGRRRRASCAARRRTTSSRSTCPAARTSSRPSRRAG